jgi:hypothetical protein
MQSAHVAVDGNKIMFIRRLGRNFLWILKMLMKKTARKTERPYSMYLNAGKHSLSVVLEMALDNIAYRTIDVVID